MAPEAGPAGPIRRPRKTVCSARGSGIVSAMADIIPFRKPKASERHKGSTLCRRGFHKWVVVSRPFDVKRGKLVTCYRCERCGVEKSRAE